MTKATFLTHVLLAGISVSFIGAKDCIGGKVSLGALDDDATAGKDGGNVSLAGSAGQPQSAAEGGRSGSTGNTGSTGGSGAAGSSNATADPNEIPLGVDDHGQLGAADFGVSGTLYIVSDGRGANGASASGACELAGHAPSECAQIGYASNKPTSICASGTVEKVLDIVGTPGTPDYGAMWGAGVAFNFVQDGANRLAYDASAHRVIGIAFDIDRVPQRGLRVEILPETRPNEPAVWRPSQSASFSSPVQPGSNRVLFQDAAALPFYTNQSALDPRRLLSVQFHVPTNNVTSDFDFCISNLTLLLGTPPPPPPASSEDCPGSLTPSHGFAYDPSTQCLSAFTTKIGCQASGPRDELPGVPATPAIAHLPCVRRLSDDALFIALESSTGPLAWKTLPESAWPRLPTTEFADCTAEEAALLDAAQVCVVLPI